ncbi:MAG: ABC transporter permease [Anaerolineaceae bacterium]|nr:ABC transporter permease [Anaerolineaceae bacterium]
MISQIVKKIIMTLPKLLVISIILFFLINILPGNAAMSMIADDSSADYYIQLQEKMGLNRPAAVRYWEWLTGMLHGDFGNSLINGQPVAERILQRLPCTLELTFLAIIISVLIAIPAGIISAVKRNSLLDISASIFSMVGVAMPSFWLGMLLIILFSLKLRLLPASGFVSISKGGLVANLRNLILPAVAVGVAFTATVMRQTRSALLEVLGQDYVLTAQAKGLKDRVVIWKHALRNALIPVITVISMQIGRLIGGVIVVESVFVLPGMGNAIADAIKARDYPIAMGMIMIVATSVVFINLLVDILYVFIDPRITHGKR